MGDDAKPKTQNAKPSSEGPESERSWGYDASLIVVARIVVKAIVIALIVVTVIDLVLAITGYRPKNGDRRAYGKGLEEGDSVFFRHSHASVGRRIAWEISCVHADSGCEFHEIVHGGIDKTGAGRCGHINVGVHHHSPIRTVNDFAVDAGNVIEVLVSDLKRSGRSQVTGASGTDRRLHHGAFVVKEVGFLFCQIELN